MKALALALFLLVSLTACAPKYGDNTCYIAVSGHNIDAEEVPCE